MASPNVSEIVTTTIERRNRRLADNVTQNTALLYKLKSSGKVRPFNGGRVIYEELSYAENQTYKRYTGYELLDIDPSDVLSAAEFAIKQAAVAVTISGLEQLQNAGREAFIDLIRSRVMVAEATFMNELSKDLYSDGTADGGKQINGLQAIIDTTPATGTVGAINAANYDFWRNKQVDGGSVSATNIQGHMDNLWTKQVRNQDKPDLIPADDNMWRFYLNSLQANQRHANTQMADAGFTNIQYMSAPVVLDGGVGGDAPTNRMYFLNCKYLHWRPHASRNMVAISPDRHSTNQDATIKLIGWAGNLTCSNRQLQGVLWT